MTKKQWLQKKVLVDEWGRPPSLADVPLIYGSREKSFELNGYSDKEINKLYKEFKHD